MFTSFYCKRKINIEELREVLALMEYQETADRYTDTVLEVNGDDAHIEVKVDKNGNVTLR